MTQRLMFFFVLAISVWSACTEPTPFGSELLADKIAEFEFTDTLTLNFTLEEEDSILSSDRGSVAGYFLCGQLDDPFFGKSTAEIYTLFQLSTLSPDFSNSTLDSIVLYLRYNASGIYGDTTMPHTLRVSRLNEVLQNGQPYYSNSTLEVGEQLGALENFLPMPTSNVPFRDSGSASAPFIRVPLSSAFGEELLMLDSAQRTNDSLFYEAIRGLHISVEPSTAPGSVLAFNLNENTFSFIRLYYTQNDTLEESFDFFFRGANKFVAHAHDRTGAPVEQLIGQPLNDLMYVQGMTGLKLKMQIPFASKLQNIAVNKAELQMTVAQQPGDFDALQTADQLVFTTMNTDSTVVFNPDVSYALGPTSLAPGFADFGGFPLDTDINGMTMQQYKMTLTTQFQDIVQDSSATMDKSIIFINVYTQFNSAMRSILYGPGNDNFPAKLSVKYTRIP